MRARAGLRRISLMVTERRSGTKLYERAGIHGTEIALQNAVSATGWRRILSESSGSSFWLPRGPIEHICAHSGLRYRRLHRVWVCGPSARKRKMPKAAAISRLCGIDFSYRDWPCRDRAGDDCADPGTRGEHSRVCCNVTILAFGRRVVDAGSRPGLKMPANSFDVGTLGTVASHLATVRSTLSVRSVGTATTFFVAFSAIVLGTFLLNGPQISENFAMMFPRIVAKRHATSLRKLPKRSEALFPGKLW